jgi:hypothetical protein
MVVANHNFGFRHGSQTNDFTYENTVTRDFAMMGMYYSLISLVFFHLFPK